MHRIDLSKTIEFESDRVDEISLLIGSFLSLDNPEQETKETTTETTNNFFIIEFFFNI